MLPKSAVDDEPIPLALQVGIIRVAKDQSAISISTCYCLMTGVRCHQASAIGIANERQKARWGHRQVRDPDPRRRHDIGALLIPCNGR
jgi:hypothetical protein